MKTLVFLGPPGAGKGTMAEKIIKTFGLNHISTGDILRAEMSSGSDLGKQVEDCMKRGELVSDKLVADIVEKKLSQPETTADGLILDGYPRTVPQAELLDAIMQKTGVKLNAVVYYEANRDGLLKRLTARRVCTGCKAVYNVMFSPPKEETICDKCGSALKQRSDDTLETAENRLTIYEKQTAPLVEWYTNKGLLKKVSADGTIEENFKATCKAVGLEEKNGL